MTVAPGAWRRRARAGLRWTLSAAAALGVLAIAVGVAALVTGEPLAERSWTIPPLVAAALASGLLWGPAGRWARRTAARLVHGGVRDPEDVVRTFGRRAARDLDDDEMLVQVSESLVRAFRAASAEVWRDVGDGAIERQVSVPSREPVRVTLDDGARRILAGGGVVGRAWLEMWQPDLLEDRPIGEVRVAPVTHGGVLLGLIVVSRLAGGDRYSSEDDASLAELGGRLGVVLHNRELDATLRETLEDLRRTNAELRASRVRLVTTADAERRRLERNLHDGAQQHLVALAVNLRLSADEIAAHPESAHAVFEALGRDVREAITELRSLAHGIYPPLLMDSGLVEALTVSARRSTSTVSLTSNGVQRYAPEVEAAVYFCCMEALQNATKHAPEATVRLHLDEADGVLRFMVSDDGPGVGDGATRRGHGMDNMADRMGAIGGALQVSSPPGGGTVVAGSVPITR